jgi:hypothetical protein
MSDANNLPNTISDGANGIDRSNSNARFQIAKVFDDEPNKVLSETTSIPIGKLSKHYAIINILFK